MKFERQNLIMLNREEKLPQFNGIFYQFKTKLIEDDEFVSIDEDNNSNTKNNNLHYNCFQNYCSILQTVNDST